MKTLEDAWRWYLSTKLSLEQMQRIGERYWKEIPWDNEPSIGRDDTFRTLEAPDITSATAASLAPMDDLAIVVLFSVFESLVRDHLVERISPEVNRLIDPILKEAASDALRGVKEGSFYRWVLEPLKEQRRVPANLITQIDQVRDFRNWVAHGRRGDATNSVSPPVAYQRLKDFLEALDIAVKSDQFVP